MAIPSVVQGLIEVKGGKVFELDSPKGAAWVEAIGSFRFEPAGDAKPCTIRREPSGYWYGCRKVAGKVRKKYIGKSSEVSVAKLEEIAKALDIPPVPQVKKVAEVAQEVTQVAEVAEVAQEVTQVAEVAEKVAEKVAQDRLTALELEVANLRKTLETLLKKLPGKSEAGDSAELPKADNKVAEKLHSELSNLRADNEWLRQKFAESRDTIETLNWGTEELNEQLEALRAENQRLQNDLSNSQTDETFAVPGVEDSEFLKEENEGLKRLLDKKSPLALSDFCVELQKLRERHREYRLKTGEERRVSIVQIADLKRQAENMGRSNQEKQTRLDELEIQTKTLQAELCDARAIIASSKPAPAESALRLEIDELRSELSDLKQKPATASKDLPEAADILNQLKAKRKKSKTDLADLEAILEILES